MPGTWMLAHALEEIAVGDGELRQDFLVLDVHLHLDMVLGAPFPFHAEEILAEEIGPHVAIVGEDAVALVQINDRRTQPRRDRRCVMEATVAR